MTIHTYAFIYSCTEKNNKIEILIFVKFLMYILQNYIVIFDKCGKSRHRSTL